MVVVLVLVLRSSEFFVVVDTHILILKNIQRVPIRLEIAAVYGNQSQ